MTTAASDNVEENDAHGAEAIIPDEAPSMLKDAAPACTITFTDGNDKSNEDLTGHDNVKEREDVQEPEDSLADVGGEEEPKDPAAPAKTSASKHSSTEDEDDYEADEEEGVGEDEAEKKTKRKRRGKEKRNSDESASDEEEERPKAKKPRVSAKRVKEVSIVIVH